MDNFAEIWIAEHQLARLCRDKLPPVRNRSGMIRDQRLPTFSDAVGKERYDIAS